jgi:hypothetical protein
MGLELIEFVMAVEDAFGIAIPNEDAIRLDTPAKLIDYLCVRVGESADGAPLVQTAFYHLRAALVSELGVSREQVRVQTTIAELTDRPENDVWSAVAARLAIPTKAVTHAPVQRWLAKLVRAPGRSVGAVADQLAMMRPSALKVPPATWTRAQISEVVFRLLEHEIGVAVGPSDLDASFVRDLGMG